MPSISDKSHAASQWENEGGAMRPSTNEADVGLNLAAHGITAIPLTIYEWSGYRYSNAKDAIAAAQRNIR